MESSEHREVLDISEQDLSKESRSITKNIGNEIYEMGKTMYAYHKAVDKNKSILHKVADDTATNLQKIQALEAELKFLKEECGHVALEQIRIVRS